MPSLLNVATNIIGPILIVVGLSVLLGRHFKLDARVLSRLGIYLFMPCLVLESIAHSSLKAKEIWQISAVTLVCATLVTLIGWGVGTKLRFNHQFNSAFVLSVSLINVGNFGLPLNDFAFGKAGLDRALIAFIVMTVWTYTVGIFLASRGSGSIRQSLINVFSTPLLYATAAGLVLSETNVILPLPLQQAISLLGQATVPTMLVVLGLQLSQTSLRGRLGPVFWASGIRLLAAPLIAIPLAALLGLTGVTRQVSIIQASMPTGVMSGVLATEFGNDADFITAVVLVSTLVSIGTLSFLLWFVM